MVGVRGDALDAWRKGIPAVPEVEKKNRNETENTNEKLKTRTRNWKIG